MTVQGIVSHRRIGIMRNLIMRYIHRYLVRHNRSRHGRWLRHGWSFVWHGYSQLLVRVHVRLLLSFAGILLVTYAFVAEPVGHLGHGNVALSGKLFFGLFTGIRIVQMRVKIGVEYVRSLFAEVAPFASGVEESASEGHHSLAGLLLQLNLNVGEFPLDLVDSLVGLASCYRTCAALYVKQSLHVVLEVLAVALVLVQLRVIPALDRVELVPVVLVLDSVSC